MEKFKITSQIALDLGPEENQAEALSAFKVKLPVFEGPFNLLLHLIDEGQINIMEVSLHEITSAYLNYIKLLDHLNITVASEFLLLASYLLEMKSKSLLPVEETFEFKTEPSPEEIERSLLEHLNVYKIFKQAAQSLKERKEIFEKVYSRHILEEGGLKEDREIFLVDINLRDLVQAFAKIWEAAEAREGSEEIEDDSVTVADKIKEILSKIKEEPKGVVFESLFNKMSKLEIVVTFLSILELIRQKLIRVMQEEVFGAILVKPWKA